MKLALHMPWLCYKARAWVGLRKSPTRIRWWPSPLGAGQGVLTWMEEAWDLSLDRRSRTLADPGAQKFSPPSPWEQPVTCEPASGWALEHRAPTWTPCAHADESAIASCWCCPSTFSCNSVWSVEPPWRGPIGQQSLFSQVRGGSSSQVMGHENTQRKSDISIPGPLEYRGQTCRAYYYDITMFPRTSPVCLPHL